MIIENLSREEMINFIKQSSPKYTQEEIENAIRGSILRFNEQIDELSKEYEAEFKQILDEIYNKIIGEYE